MYIIISVLLFMAIIVSFFLLRKDSRKKFDRDKAIELKRAFSQIVRKHKILIDEVEVFNNRVIGLDRKNRKLIWIGYSGDRVIKYCISLRDVESFNIKSVPTVFESNSDRIVMELNFRNRGPVNFVFYDSALDNPDTYFSLFKKAKSWDAKIHVYVNSFPLIHEFGYAI